MLHTFAQKYTQIETHMLLLNAWFTHITTIQAYNDTNTQIAFVQHTDFCFRFHTQLPCEHLAQILSVRYTLHVYHDNSICEDMGEF